jgi:hypothetical protein
MVSYFQEQEFVQINDRVSLKHLTLQKRSCRATGEKRTKQQFLPLYLWLNTFHFRVTLKTWQSRLCVAPHQLTAFLDN